MDDTGGAASAEFKKERERIFSAEELRENFMGNMELVRSILDRFISRTEQQIAEIPGLVERGDWETAVRETHTIKGSARNLSALELGDAAMRWEAACRQKDPAALGQLYSDTAEAFARFKTAAGGFLTLRPEGED
jgi:HPt (histidine-containing phosphotransfer) domain-containing protein